MNKRFYWLKLNDNFFDREEIKIVEDMPNGKDYIIFYLKLLLKSVKTEGKLKFRDVLPYTPEMLSSITGTNVDTVRAATSLFTKLNLMELWDDGTLFMIETQNMIGTETDSAKRMRELRERNKSKELPSPSQSDEIISQCDNNVTNSDIEIEKDRELDIDLDKEKDLDKELKNNNIPFEEIVNYLNKKAGTKYKASSKKTKELIKARWNEGFKLEDFKTVIKKKADEWLNTEFEKYLRPETIFGTKFENYLNQKVNKHINSKNSTFNSFDQRSYDFDELEKKLLEQTPVNNEIEPVDSEALIKKIKKNSKK